MDDKDTFLDPLTQSLYSSGFITKELCVKTLGLNEEAVDQYFNGNSSALSYDDRGRISFLAFALNSIVRETSIQDSIRDHLAVLVQSGFSMSLIARWLGLDCETFDRMLHNPDQEPSGDVLEFSDKLSRLTSAVLANRNNQVEVQQS